MNPRLAHVMRWQAKNWMALDLQTALERRRNSRQNISYYKRRAKSDVAFRVLIRLRSRVGAALRANASSKAMKTSALLGCTIAELMVHLESQFTEGMSWDNYGQHIDHREPCRKFDLLNPEEQRRCFHYSNLQPLWALDNFRKGGR